MKGLHLRSRFNSFKQKCRRTGEDLDFPFCRPNIKTSSGVILPSESWMSQCHCHFKSFSLDKFQAGERWLPYGCCFYVIHFYIIIYPCIYSYIFFFFLFLFLSFYFGETGGMFCSLPVCR